MGPTQRLGLVLSTTFVVAFIGFPRAAQEPVDSASLDKIKALGLDAKSSTVMEIASYLTDVHGPRLTGSANILKAGEWTVAKMKEWGLEGAALEPWPVDGSGQNNGFPCGWSNDKFYMAAVSPQAFPISGTPTAWSPGTNGLVRGEVVLVTETTEAALDEKFAVSKLKGKWVITANAPEVQAYFTAPGSRYTKEQLDRMENPPPPDPNAPGRGGRQGGRAGAPPAAGAPAAAPAAAAGRGPVAAPGPPPRRRDVCAGRPEDPAWRAAQTAQPPAAGGRGGPAGAAPAFNRSAYFKRQGVLGTFTTAARGHGVYTIGSGSRSADPATLLPAIVIPAEDFGRIARLIAKNIAVTVEADIRNSYTPNPPMFNVVGEIRGTDKADELVMLGAHFDSWHASTGATDNAAGSAAMLEAMRILKQSGVPLRRTVRIGLWTGEEQGLFGSAHYVATHFGGGRGGRGAAPRPSTPAHAKFSGYFNIDNGTGAIRGVYLQQNQAVGPIFRTWMEPFNALGMTHLVAGNTGGTDHQSFDAAGLPGWQFVQDEIEYNAMTHHTNLDSYERLQAEDMRKNATIAAAFAFLAANRNDLLPRKPAAPPAGRGQ